MKFTLSHPKAALVYLGTYLIAFCWVQTGMAQVQPATNPSLYHILRAEDDFTHLRNDSLPPDFFDPVKYIPLSKKPNYYWSFGGEVRYQYEIFRNENWGDIPAEVKDEKGHLLQRYMLHTDLHLGPHVRVFGQLTSNYITGRKGGPRPMIDQNELDIYQLFGEFSFSPKKDHQASMRVGRQELMYGAERLITMREGPNIRLSFDAAKLVYKSNQWQIDAFVARPVDTKLFVLDDAPNLNQLVWALYTVRTLPALRGGLDMYYIGLDKQQARYYQGVADERRHTAGIRFWSKKESLRFDHELILQGGRFGAGTIRAFLLSAVWTYQFNGLPLRPTITLANNLISGDGDPADADLQTFNPLYPRPFFGLAAPLGPSNLMDIHPGVGGQFGKKVQFLVDIDFLWRYSAKDAMYSPAVVQSRPPVMEGETMALMNVPEKYIGNQLNGDITYQLNPHITLSFSYAHFTAGKFIKSTGAGKNLSYYKPSFTFKF